MPKVFATWEMKLRPGVTEKEFELFVREEFSSVPRAPGTKPCILKGERGEGLGRYLLLNEFESVELRDRYFPTDETMSKEAEERMQTPIAKKLLSLIEEPVTGDYVLLVEW